MRIVVAVRDAIVALDPGHPDRLETVELDGARPACLTADARRPRRVWCGTTDAGVHRSDDGGRTWRSNGLEGEEVTAVAASPVEEGADGAVVYAGTEPSAMYRSADGGTTWDLAPGLDDLPSASTWSFPPRPETHHVRWIACHPREAGRLYVAIEAGALVSTPDGGHTWEDRAPDGPLDTHELAIHPERPDRLRVSAGDGYFESDDGGRTWSSPEEGLEVTYLRSVMIDPGDPDVVVVSAASRARSAYVAGRSDGRLYRREGDGPWRPVASGWPDPPETIAPLLAAGNEPGEMWAASERGVHRTADGGRSWDLVAPFDPAPPWIRGIVRTGEGVP